MKNIYILVLSLVLLGAGCLSGSKTESTADGGVFKTVNNGGDWIQATVVPTAQGTGTLATTDILDIEMDPQDSKYLYVSTRGNGLLYSEDGGGSWRQPSVSGLRDQTVYDVEVDPKDVCTVYAAVGRNLYGTRNCLRTFDDEMYLETRPGVFILKISVDWFNPDILWLGLSNGDVLKSTNRGVQWKTVKTLGEEISQIIISNQDSRQVMVSKFRSGIERTLDAGQTWEPVSFPDGTPLAKNVYNLVQNPDSSVVIAVTQHGLLRSKDFGTTWEVIELLTSPGDTLARAAAIDPEDSDILYYATPRAFYRSTDGGQTWDTQRFLSNREARTILVDPDDRKVLYVGVASSTK
jgi:photosystem II stability/assembly factor-like uncharacterized protein